MSQVAGLSRPALVARDPDGGSLAIMAAVSIPVILVGPPIGDADQDARTEELDRQLAACAGLRSVPYLSVSGASPTTENGLTDSGRVTALTPGQPATSGTSRKSAIR